jgi:hypothetical protein
MSVTVYGAGDDCIEIEGEIVEEFDALGRADDKEGGLLAFSDGTVLRIRYAGVWRIELVVKGSSDFELVSCPEDDEDNYSDRATLNGEIEWVVLGNQIAR